MDSFWEKWGATSFDNAMGGDLGTSTLTTSKSSSSSSKMAAPEALKKRRSFHYQIHSKQTRKTKWTLIFSFLHLKSRGDLLTHRVDDASLFYFSIPIPPPTIFGSSGVLPSWPIWTTFHHVKGEHSHLTISPRVLRNITRSHPTV